MLRPALEFEYRISGLKTQSCQVKYLLAGVAYIGFTLDDASNSEEPGMEWYITYHETALLTTMNDESPGAFSLDQFKQLCSNDRFCWVDLPLFDICLMAE